MIELQALVHSSQFSILNLITPTYLNELYGIYQVTQLTRDTVLQDLVAVDDTTVQPHCISESDYHDKAETILFTAVLA